MVGLALRLGCALILAVVAGSSYFLPLPRWLWPVIEVLNWPIAWAWFQIFPTEDSFPPFLPGRMWPGFAMYLVLAVSVYTGLSLSPQAARWAIRVTRASISAPWVFVLYFVARGVLGGMAGLMLWSTSASVGSEGAMLRFVGFGALVFGWALAIVRGRAERWQHR